MSVPFIVAEPSGRCYERLHEIAADYNITLYHSIVVDNIRAIVELLQDSRSASFLPRYSVSNFIEKKKISVLDVDLAPQIYYSQVIYHRDKWLSQYMECFIELVRRARPEVLD